MENSVLILLIYLGLVSGVFCFPAQTQELCNEVMAIDCKTRYVPSGIEELCGNNGVTYLNKCFFVQAKCKNAMIEQTSIGKCDPNSDSNNSEIDSNNSGKVSTKTTENPQSGLQTTHHPGSTQTNDNKTFCKNNHPCPDTLDPLCGSDSVFYLNICEFKKAKCKDPDLEFLPSLQQCENNTT